MGLVVPVEVSHNKVVVVPGIGRSASSNRVMAVRYAWTPASAACAMLTRGSCCPRYWADADVHPGEGICDSIVPTMNMLNIRGVLSN